jgi:soluble lytic murein transglycosylase-like protein
MRNPSNKETLMLSRLVLGCVLAFCALPASASDRAAIDALVAYHAKVHGVPEALVHRVIRRESGYNPRALSKGNFGLMQIRYATARGMGYRGPASGLLDANTNLTYAVPYLANAYLVAGGNQDRAVSLYSSGYYYVAKRKGLLNALRTGVSAPVAVGSLWPNPTTSRSSAMTMAEPQ